MWIRLRLDIGWSDLCRGLVSCITARDCAAARASLERSWSDGADDALACLSVRSAFDLLLGALDLEPGSEVLFSAVTVPGMPAVARAHGLVPVPVDLSDADFHVNTVALAEAFTERTKVLVIAHLFGARPDISALCDAAHERGVIVVEDCAQAWCGDGWRGSPNVDASLFSFGTIKTGTALGGALARVRDASLLARMRAIQAAYRIQSQRRYALQFPKIALLKMVAARPVMSVLARYAASRGKTVDDLLGGMTRGFSESDLMPQLRRQPCAALLTMLRHRVETYDTSRVTRRIANARKIIERLEFAEAYPELLDERHSFWLFPFPADDPQAVIDRLRQHGFDSARRGRLEVVPPPGDQSNLACDSAAALLDRTVFLPCYPEMPPMAIDRMCEAIQPLAKPAQPALR